MERYLHKRRVAPSLLSPATGEIQEGIFSAVFIWLRLFAALGSLWFSPSFGCFTARALWLKNSRVCPYYSSPPLHLFNT